MSWLALESHEHVELNSVAQIKHLPMIALRHHCSRMIHWMRHALLNRSITLNQTLIRTGLHADLRTMQNLYLKHLLLSMLQRWTKNYH